MSRSHPGAQRRGLVYIVFADARWVAVAAALAATALVAGCGAGSRVQHAVSARASDHEFLSHAARAGWSAPRGLVRPTAVFVRGAGNAAGAEAFVWQVEMQPQRALNGLPVSFIRARMRSANGRLSRTQTISPTNLVAHSASIGLDLAGNATAVWVEGDNLHTDRIVVAFRPAGGRFSVPVAVADPGITPPALAVAPDGAAAIVWAQDYAVTVAIQPRPDGVQRPVTAAALAPRSVFAAAESPP